jgi:nucleotide-binding universal stress UspA family protein
MGEGGIMFQHILVPLDGSELSKKAADTSLELARKLGARITGFVAEPMPPLPSMGSHAATYARQTDEHQLRTEAHAHEVLQHFEAKAVNRAWPSPGSSAPPTRWTTPS